jgi:hypothetical protein
MMLRPLKTAGAVRVQAEIFGGFVTIANRLGASTIPVSAGDLSGVLIVRIRGTEWD